MLHHLPSEIHHCIMLHRRLISTTATSVASAKKEEQYCRCARSLLATMLLNEEEIKTNEAAEAEYNPDLLGRLASADFLGAISSPGVKASALTKKMHFQM
mmetsp:Transcript_36526/g.53394  ORF Transcript_36526/g.53394 Transcript_36526/m.53394 type:complete len:100 (+) Transcript_36526:206-505(+)